MTLALAVLIAIFAALLGLVTFVQLLYLESLRLRTRDLPAIKFFRETLEEKIGFEKEDGAVLFSFVKHTPIVLLAVLYFLLFADGAAWTWPVVWETVVASWLTMIATAKGLPHVLRRRRAAQWLAPMARLMRVIGLRAKPFVAVLGFFQSMVDLTDVTNGAEEPPTQAENIEALISAGTEEGLIEEEDRKLIQSVVEFGDKVVREVMTPRPNIVAISADAPLEQLRQLVINEQYSRIPIYEVTIDQVVGFVHVRDMFEVEEDQRASRKVREVLRPIRLVPETKPVNDLMREMQQDNTHMVIVVDEYGNTAGLATMEDLVEVILGEIRDEHEPDSDVTEDGSGGYIVSGNFDIARVADILSFKPDEDIESTTIGGLVTEWLGGVPKPREIFERVGIGVEIMSSDEMRVKQGRLSVASVGQLQPQEKQT